MTKKKTNKGASTVSWPSLLLLPKINKAATSQPTNHLTSQSANQQSKKPTNQPTNSMIFQQPVTNEQNTTEVTSVISEFPI